MSTRTFIRQLRHDDIVGAIHAAELHTSGEIRVFVSRKEILDPVGAAQRCFLHHGMQQTRHRNGVLIFLAPRSRKFAVVGDTAVHEKCGDEFWQELTAAMSGHFQKGDFNQGILHGIQKAGELLARHFPRHPGERDRLPDDIAHD